MEFHTPLNASLEHGLHRDRCGRAQQQEEFFPAGTRVFQERGDVWDHGTTRFVHGEGSAGIQEERAARVPEDPWAQVDLWAHMSKQTPATGLYPQN